MAITKGVVLVAGELKTPYEWSIIDGVILFEGNNERARRIKLTSKRKINLEDWTEMVMSSHSFRLVPR